MDAIASTTRHICVMGVSGSGKTTIATRLAHELHRVFCDADDLHPQRNIDAMAAGRPLTDADRAPWLDAVVAWCDRRAAAGESTVVACSALRRSYRDRLSEARGGMLFVGLAVPEHELRRRLRSRTGHFMTVTLLTSQLQTFEELQPDENAVSVDASGAVDDVVRAASDAVRRP